MELDISSFASENEKDAPRDGHDGGEKPPLREGLFFCPGTQNSGEHWGRADGDEGTDRDPRQFECGEEAKLKAREPRCPQKKGEEKGFAKEGEPLF